MRQTTPLIGRSAPFLLGRQRKIEACESQEEKALAQRKPQSKRIHHCKPFRRRNDECAMRHRESLVLNRTGKKFCPGDGDARGVLCQGR